MQQVVGMTLAVAGPAIHVMVCREIFIVFSPKRDPSDFMLIAINEAKCGLPFLSLLRARVQAGQPQAVYHC